jgi:hypothetical protein
MSSFLFGLGFGLSLSLAITFTLKHRQEAASMEAKLLGPEDVTQPPSLASALSQQPPAEAATSSTRAQT